LTTEKSYATIAKLEKTEADILNLS